MLLLRKHQWIISTPEKSSKSLAWHPRNRLWKLLERKNKDSGVQFSSFSRQDLHICHVMLGKFLSCSEPHSRQTSLLFITNLPDTFLPSIQRPLDSLPPHFPFLSLSSSVKRFSDHYLLSCLYPPISDQVPEIFYTFLSSQLDWRIKSCFLPLCTQPTAKRPIFIK